MTNREYIEKNNISIPEAIEMWRKETKETQNKNIFISIFEPIARFENAFFKDDEDKFDKWLKETRYEKHKFEIGDFVIKENEKDRIGVVIDVKDYVYFRWVNRRGFNDVWDISKGDNKYYRHERDIYYMKDETLYKKIF